jgi:hypothetical protein
LELEMIMTDTYYDSRGAFDDDGNWRPILDDAYFDRHDSPTDARDAIADADITQIEQAVADRPH